MTKLSLRDAINRKCKECIHDPYGGMGQWRESVDACSSSNCPLHPVRPRTYRGEKAKRLANDAPEAPEPTDAAETDVSALLSGVFGREGGAAG